MNRELGDEDGRYAGATGRQTRAKIKYYQRFLKKKKDEVYLKNGFVGIFQSLFASCYFPCCMTLGEEDEVPESTWLSDITSQIEELEEKYPHWAIPMRELLNERDNSLEYVFISEMLWEVYCFHSTFRLQLCSVCLDDPRWMFPKSDSQGKSMANDSIAKGSNQSTRTSQQDDSVASIRHTLAKNEKVPSSAMKNELPANASVWQLGYDQQNDFQVFREQLAMSCLFGDTYDVIPPPDDGKVGMGATVLGGLDRHGMAGAGKDLRSTLVQPAAGRMSSAPRPPRKVSIDSDHSQSSLDERPMNFRNNTLLPSNYYINSMDNHNQAIMTKEKIAQKVKLVEFNQKLYKTITEIICRHVSVDPRGGLFKQMLKTFAVCFEETYEPKFTAFTRRVPDVDIVREVVDHAVEDISMFAVLIYDSMREYYKFDLLIKSQEETRFVFSRDNLLNFILSLIFSLDNVYSLMFGLVEMQCNDEIMRVSKGIEQCFPKSIDFFGVSALYRLNEDSVADIEVRKAKRRAKREGNINGASEEQKSPPDSPKAPQKKIFKPYQAMIDTIRGIARQKSPLHKLKHILETAQMINKEIKAFMAEQNFVDPPVLDGDQVFAIILYIVTKSKTSNLMAHLRFISKFTTQNLQTSVSGYYCVTLEAAAQFLIEKGT